MFKKNNNYLDVIPVKHSSCSFHIDDGMGIIEMEHKGIYNKLAQKLFHKPKVSHINLDKFGTFVYSSVDGEKSIYEISELVHKEFGKDAEPLIERLVQYMRILKNNNFIDYKKKV